MRDTAEDQAISEAAQDLRAADPEKLRRKASRAAAAEAAGIRSRASAAGARAPGALQGEKA